MALGLQTLPSVCWMPLALLWFGQTESAMLFVVVMGTVWSVLIATDTGARTIPPIYARAARTMGSEGFHQWTRVILPASLPFLVSGMKQGWAFAWRSLMAAEIYVTILTGFGLGHLLHYGRELNAMDQVIGIMLVIVAHRPAGRQDAVLALGALPAPPLGHRRQAGVEFAAMAGPCGDRTGGMTGHTCCHQFSSIFSAAMKASCGISTWPNWRIFFLPFFCFSSSLRFLVMSPP